MPHIIKILLSTLPIICIHLVVTMTTSNDDAEEEKMVMCNFVVWGAYKKGKAFVPEHIDPLLCTHVVYSSAKLNGLETTIEPREPSLDIGRGFYQKIIGLKGKNPKLKVLLAVGGWEDSKDGNFSAISQSVERRLKFAKNCLNYLQKYGFDGLCLDWLYPKCWQAQCTTGLDSDKENFVDLLEAIKSELQPHSLILMASLSWVPEIIEGGHDIPRLNEVLDLMYIMTLDMHGDWEETTGHVAPLFKGPPTHDQYEHANVNDTISRYISLGANKSKLIMGVPAYGRSFGVEIPGNFDRAKVAYVGVKKSGSANQGEFSKEEGLLAYFEICANVRNLGWTVYREKNGLRGPIVVGNFEPDKNLTEIQISQQKKQEALQWIGYDDPEIVRKKAKFIKKNGLAGVYVARMDLDDFSNDCCQGPSPLLRSLAEELLKIPSRVVSHNETKMCAKFKSTNVPELSEVTGSTPATGNDGGWAKEVSLGVAATGAILITFFAIIAGIFWRKYSRTKAQLRNLSAEEVKEFREGNPHKGGGTGTVQTQIKGDPTMPDIGSMPFDPRYEVSMDDLDIDSHKILGQGQYGLVLKGQCRQCPVAIKTTKPKADVEYFKALLGELKIMTFVGKHEHIVDFIGASTARIEERVLYVVVELSPLGDLHSYLKKYRHDLVLTVPKSTDDDQESRNSLYENDLVPKLSCKVFANWCSQIATGMVYLESKRVIHSDLATRNVLLFENNVVKITDFGLSRQLYLYDNYTKKNRAQALPWRWLSLEALRYLEFSSKSDVWSLGVTIWEIFSVAEIPYPGIQWTSDFTSKIANGLRLERPQLASDDVYDIMMRCWDAVPETRISFQEIQTFFSNLVQK